eukprot:Plantae.Rhodophyta-Palmaria_palmata.ctg15605.p3 GENE.Plantae.Rhodophyta-Palmaria_palmata.ctg15605~~Plantae.Rhodophyta-Palmaria_palmata.ctg15605.p3  ORF type:complete len:105 (+),score=15.26 Plantae.Rhodophyta-Palmaria_palmata.ctg15605:939-1253(+)
MDPTRKFHSTLRNAVLQAAATEDRKHKQKNYPDKSNLRIFTGQTTNINAGRQGFERREIFDLGLVTTGHMLADCFTKNMKPTQLFAAMETGTLRHPISNWIVRD